MTTTKSFTRFLPAVARILIGLPLFISGLNGLLKILPEPTPQISEGALAFSEALMKTGYMLQLIFITQLTVGMLLLVNRFVPLAIVLLAPFLVNAMAFHIFLEHTGLPVVSAFVLVELYLAWQYRKAYVPLFEMRAKAGDQPIIPYWERSYSAEPHAGASRETDAHSRW
jgi:uncharacterized membrane protein YphA (DoxX/SURF4 family)